MTRLTYRQRKLITAEMQRRYDADNSLIADRRQFYRLYHTVASELFGEA